MISDDLVIRSVVWDRLGGENLSPHLGRVAVAYFHHITEADFRDSFLRNSGVLGIQPTYQQ